MIFYYNYNTLYIINIFAQNGVKDLEQYNINNSLFCLKLCNSVKTSYKKIKLCIKLI